jgi:hypothetical protein
MAEGLGISSTREHVVLRAMGTTELSCVRVALRCLSYEPCDRFARNRSMSEMRVAPLLGGDAVSSAGEPHYTRSCSNRLS